MEAKEFYAEICKLEAQAQRLLDIATEQTPPTVARLMAWLAAAVTLLENLKRMGVPSDDEDDTRINVGGFSAPDITMDAGPDADRLVAALERSGMRRTNCEVCGCEMLTRGTVNRCPPHREVPS